MFIIFKKKIFKFIEYILWWNSTTMANNFVVRSIRAKFFNVENIKKRLQCFSKWAASRMYVWKLNDEKLGKDWCWCVVVDFKKNLEFYCDKYKLLDACTQSHPKALQKFHAFVGLLLEWLSKNISIDSLLNYV